MDLDFSPDEQRFRDEVRDWLATHVPKQPRPPSTPETRDFDMGWQRTQFEGGWAGINWPKEYGGRGASLIEQLIWHEEYARADAPEVGYCFVGVNHAGPTLIVNGTDEQKAFHLPKILSGEVLWCQGFSEPGAGSDLAGIRTRGHVDGDHLVVNGQKIWTSYAQHADYQELLVRTDPDSTRSAGLTWIICDMHLPGITVRPIKLLTGRPDLSEVFYDDVRIPLANVVGGIGNGWRVAMSTLSFERGTAFTAAQIRLARSVEELIELARATPDPVRGGTMFDRERIADRLAELRADVTALRAMTYTNISRLKHQTMPGPEGSMMKLSLSTITKEVRSLSMEILGAGALAYPYGTDGPVHDYLYSYASSVGGGTSEIQREIIAERLLGLPRSR